MRVDEPGWAPGAAPAPTDRRPGYSLEGAAQQTLARGATGFLQKPFVLAQLAECIAGALQPA